MNVEKLGNMLNACKGAIKWVGAQPNPVIAWETCERGDWLIWLVARVGMGDVVTELVRTCVDTAGDATIAAIHTASYAYAVDAAVWASRAVSHAASYARAADAADAASHAAAAASAGAAAHAVVDAAAHARELAALADLVRERVDFSEVSGSLERFTK